MEYFVWKTEMKVIGLVVVLLAVTIRFAAVAGLARSRESDWLDNS